MYLAKWEDSSYLYWKESRFIFDWWISDISLHILSSSGWPIAAFLVAVPPSTDYIRCKTCQRTTMMLFELLYNTCTYLYLSSQLHSEIVWRYMPLNTFLSSFKMLVMSKVLCGLVPSLYRFTCCEIIKTANRINNLENDVKSLI